MTILSRIRTKIEELRGDAALSLWPVLLAALVVTLQHAWVQGFFHDGNLYAAFGKNASLYGHWLVPHLSHSTYDQFFQHIPFVFVLEGLFFKLFGASYLTARLFSAFFTLLSLICLYRFLLQQKEKKWAFLSAALFVFIPPLIKKTRFPNLDVPLMCFMLLALFSYYRASLEGKWRQWLCCGFFFGLCLLTKGPLAFFVPIIIFVHAFLMKDFSVFKKGRAWLGFLFGLMVFSLWPLALYLNNQLPVFYDWYQATIIDTIFKGRGQESNQLTLYFVFLLKQTNIWFVLALMGTWNFFKSRRHDRLLGLSVAWFWSLLILLSLTKFKYSNYLMPLYPAMAMLAANSVRFKGDKFISYFSSIFRSLALTLGLVLLIFPLTHQSRRDIEITKSLEILKMHNYTPTAWGIVGEVFPFFNAANYIGFQSHGEVYDMSSTGLLFWLQGEKMNPYVKLDSEENLDIHS